MPEQRLQRTRGSLPEGYQFGDAVKRDESEAERCMREQSAHTFDGSVSWDLWYRASPVYIRYVQPNISRKETPE